MYRSAAQIEMGDKVLFNDATGYVTKADWPFDTAGLYHGIALRDIIIGEFVDKNIDVKLEDRVREEDEDKKRREKRKRQEDKKLDKR